MFSIIIAVRQLKLYWQPLFLLHEEEYWFRLFFSFPPPLAILLHCMVPTCVIMARAIIMACVLTAYCVHFVIIARAIIMANVI